MEPSQGSTFHPPTAEEYEQLKAKLLAAAPHAEPSVFLPLVQGVTANRSLRALAELARRRVTALNIYEPLPHQQKFHDSRSRIRIARGGNRSSKSTTVCVEIAQILSGTHPWFKNAPGTGICVGANEAHIANAMWPLLTKASRSFKMIRDEESGLWRAYRPWLPLDRLRADQVKFAPPIIPPSWYKEPAWKDKKGGVISKVTFNSGWELLFYPSGARPSKGFPADFFWFDEELEGEYWVAECVMRIMDRKGIGFWSATPETGTEQMMDLCEQAEVQKAAGGKIFVEEFQFSFLDNPHIDAEEKEMAQAILTPDMQLVKIHGENIANQRVVFPEFDNEIHCCDYFAIPDTWTHYAAIDPGRQVCAVAFLAVPPPNDERGDHVYLYDELYLRHSTAARLGEEMARKCAHPLFYTFLIDIMEARKHEAGSGISIIQQYAEALRRNNVACVTQGSGFCWGSTDPRGKQEAFREWLRIRPNGTAKLQVFRDKCATFLWERRRYRYKADPKTKAPTDDVVKRDDHLVDAVLLLAAHRPRYVKQKKMQEALTGMWKFLKDLKKKDAARRGGNFIAIGPESR